MAARKRVAVIFGGRSVEHEISVISALQAIQAIDVLRYEPIPVYIAPNGTWFTGDELMQRGFYRGVPASLEKLTEVTLLPKPGKSGLTVLASPRKNFWCVGKCAPKFIPIDIFFPIFHGQFGEDGCIQGLFELANVSYVGCGVTPLAIAMSKYLCKSLLKDHGIPVLPCYLANRHRSLQDFAGLRAEILATPGLEKFPLFVKPNHLGSSIGVNRAKDVEALDAALAQSFRYDHQVIVEPCVADLLEINCSVLGSREPRASVVEIPVSETGVLSYEDKYLRGGGTKGKSGGSGSQGMAGLTRSINPTHLERHYHDNVREYSERAFKFLGCRGVVRFDFIVDKVDGNLYFNELNPIPGSLSFYLWEKSEPPLLYTEELSELLRLADEGRGETFSLKRDIGLRALAK